MSVKAWSQVAPQINGMALGPGIEAFRKRGVFEALKIGASMDDIRKQFGGNAGPLHALLRAIAALGWLKRSGPTASDQMQFQLLCEPDLSGYSEIPDLVSWAEDPTGPAPSLGNTFLKGFLVAPSLTKAELSFPKGLVAVFKELAWMDQGDRLTDLGNSIMALRSVYQYPMSYLATILRTEEFLFGDPEWTEDFVDRKRDVLFSGQVFQGQLAQEFLLVLDGILGSSKPPNVIVDFGCGDAAMLCAIGERFLEKQLTLIGIDLNESALHVARERLAAGPHRHHLYGGDIGNPQEVLSQLDGIGINKRDVLHVNKSVIHNRRFRKPTTVSTGCSTRSALITSGGAPINGPEAQESLVDFFRTWQPNLEPHGMLSIEAHSVDERSVQKWAHLSTMPCLEFTHALSRQNLLECELHRQCAEKAGLRSAASMEFGKQSQGLDYMSLNHWVVA